MRVVPRDVLKTEGQQKENYLQKQKNAIHSHSKAKTPKHFLLKKNPNPKKNRQRK